MDLLDNIDTDRGAEDGGKGEGARSLCNRQMH